MKQFTSIYRSRNQHITSSPGFPRNKVAFRGKCGDESNSVAYCISGIDKNPHYRRPAIGRAATVCIHLTLRLLSLTDQFNKLSINAFQLKTWTLTYTSSKNNHIKSL